MTLREKKQAILRVITSVNYHMNKIATNLDIDVKINTYEARHSFATTLLRSDAPLAFISQSLGHSSMATTQRYLGSFEVGKAKEYLSALIPKSPESES
ncbi:tyrosine-type recombinase/integrase [Dyadobacter subterraneus]|uniref:Tyrosine-type recombinase/integrase n=1 Tax=Dyadobacter subterraneus TaxID=2773304 RepID=A0ABR9WBG2_9BACT|nr:tyrosine-type recombinase/integrase [Dyadobacter subterraneus]MBE9462825.1 tyrosine-type recombinase/integrase [Dyadobacter subterraneus]